MASVFAMISVGRYRRLLPDFTEERTQAFTTIALSLLAFSILGFFAIQPSLTTIAQLRKELDDSKQVRDSLDLKIKNLSFLQSQYFQIEPDIPTIFAAVPQNPDAAILIGQLQAVAKDAEVTIVRINALEVELARKTEDPKLKSTYFFTLDATGSHDRITTLLSTLVDYQRIASIDSITLTKNEDAGGAYSASVRGIAYFKK